MNIHTHILGFPRIGAERELKFALERHWRGEVSEAALEATGKQLRARHWALQKEAGLDYVTVGDFAFYDQVANHIQLLGCEPARFGFDHQQSPLSRYFQMARGEEQHDHAGCSHGPADGAPASSHYALEMTKWFDTNYHYLVPEFSPQTQFSLACERLVDEVAEAQALGHQVKAALIGPLTFLWLGKEKTAGFDRLTLLDQLLPVYSALLDRLKQQGVHWVQIDEPILGLDLPGAWRSAFESSYWQLNQVGVNILLATYFSPLEENLSLACRLPVAGLHVDGIRAPHELSGVADWLPAHKVLSIGIIDGRNIWRTDLDAALDVLRPLLDKRGGKLWLAPSCSLLHTPFTLAPETGLAPELKSWLAFATEKLGELALLKDALAGNGDSTALAVSRLGVASRRASVRVHRPQVRSACSNCLRRPTGATPASRCARRCSAPVFNCRTFRPPPSARFRRPAPSAPRAPASSVANWPPPTMNRPCARKSPTPSAASRRWASTCWCMAKPSATIWSNTSASNSTASCLPAWAGCSPTVRAASSRPSFTATYSAPLP